MLKAHIWKRRTRGEREEVDISLFNEDDSPFVGGGGGVTQYLRGSGINKSVMGTNDGLYFDGSESNLDIVGFELGVSQALPLPSGIYVSSWQIGFDINADDGVGDTTRLFNAAVQPLGAQVEWSPQKPAGGWADYNPYVMENLAWNFIVPDEANDLIVMFDGSTADVLGVSYFLSFALYRLGDLPE